MIQSEFTTIFLTASEGFYITQKDDSIDIKDRIIATKIALGKYDSPDNYIEITEDQANEYKDLIEQANKQEELNQEIVE